MKDNILFIVLILVAIGATWYVRGSIADEDTRKLTETVHVLDSALQVNSRPVPAVKETVYQKQKPVTAGHRIDADSVFRAGYEAGEANGEGKGIDSVMALFAAVTAPRETTIVFQTGDTLIHQSDPLRRMDVYTLIPPARVDSIWRIVQKVYVPQPIEDSWYDHWETQVTIGALLVAVLLK